MSPSLYYAFDPLHRLNPREVHQLYKLRVDVFVHEQQCPYAEIDDTDALDSTMHVQTYTIADKELIACARIYPENGRYHLGRVVVRKNHRGQGLGKELMHQTLRYAFEQHPDWDVYLEAQVAQEKFYGDFGFVRCGHNFDWDGVEHIPMLLKSADLVKSFRNTVE
ncbi:GNAT family N-acetyltransferase [Corynebacterium felinum]|uniref:ElaA protein n=1 Tax=Corynebacterium felinum TaxID=131318 RepID=A0ABU2B6J2_9CORY|nr:GNAT family N-acetyltransferase [Corynebacterium felinum]MDF5820154.1 GNAT family N-acetyltransferase [Corynebacterium felinum]MDR7353906.1 ElaA protein [Corynebacterium felinum]WJY96079.1 putative acyltransferase [Corynebacterium felinum]